MNFKIESFCDEEINANTYLIYNQDTCIVIDPANSVKVLSNFIGDKKVLGIFLTHAHYDHFKSLNELLKQYDTKVYMHKNALKKLTDIYASCASLFSVKQLDEIDMNKVEILNEFQTKELGNYKLKCLYLPGHSNCSIGYLIDDCLFIGDVLFSTSIGRYDLPTGNYLTLKTSLAKIKTLNPNLKIYPGHNFSFILKDALKYNPYLK